MSSIVQFDGDIVKRLICSFLNEDEMIFFFKIAISPLRSFDSLQQVSLACLSRDDVGRFGHLSRSEVAPVDS